MSGYNFENLLPDSLDGIQKEIAYWTGRVGEGYPESTWDRPIKARLEALHACHLFCIVSEKLSTLWQLALASFGCPRLLLTYGAGEAGGEAEASAWEACVGWGKARERSVTPAKACWST
jgi:hypothetical protein